jgi:hypothetical protein
MNANTKNKSRFGLFVGIAACLLVLLAFIAGIEIWHLQIATYGYFLLIGLSPVLVLLVSDLKQIKKPA